MDSNIEMQRQMYIDLLARADEGVFISEEKVTAWFESLGTEKELPKPNPDVFLKHS